MIKLTIFTPTYNRSKLIRRVFESLNNQTCFDFVWLVVDDGSTDDTQKTISEITNISNFEIKYIFQENGGKHRAHNTAVKKCNTDYLFILDSDDTVEKNTIETLYKYINYIDNEDSISGIIGNRFDRNSGEVIGTYMPDINIASGIELYQKYKFNGDTLRVYKTKILKQFPFPEINNETFIYENVVFDKIDQQYKMLIIHDKLYIGEYLQDGYTNNAKYIKINNPIGYSLSLRSAAETAVLFKKKIGLYILYLIWCDKMKIKKDIKNNLWIWIFMPIVKAFEIIKFPHFFFEILNCSKEKKTINKFKIWKKTIIDFVYSFNGSKAEIYSANETLRNSIKNRKSIIRFGDGEFKIMNGQGIHYQEFNQELSEELKAIIHSYEKNNKKSNYLLCFPKNYMKCKGFRLLKKRVLISSWSFPRRYFLENINQDIAYGDAFCFSRNNNLIDDFIKELKDKICIFIHNNEKYATKFEEKYKIKTVFIDIPNKNCYKYLEDILKRVNNYINRKEKDSYFVLISAGPCGKIIAKRLSDDGIYAIDCGHCWDDPLV